MASIPSTGSLIATTDYYRRRVGSTSSNTSCGSGGAAEYGEVIPHPPGLPRRDSGNWWSSFFFPKGNMPGGIQNGPDPVMNGSYTVVNGQVTCIAREMAKQQRRISDSSDSSGKFESLSTVQPSSPPPTTPNLNEQTHCDTSFIHASSS